LNHVINSLTFGDTHNFYHIKKYFGQIDNGQHTIFNMFMKDGRVNNDLKNQVEDVSQDYFYFLKVVPHRFIDKTRESWQAHSSYSYSLNHNKKENGRDSPSVTLILDYAPINMIITKSWRPLGQFMTDMCSIVGGVFIICGLLNGFFNRLF
jgi:hypothetical protein